MKKIKSFFAGVAFVAALALAPVSASYADSLNNEEVVEVIDVEEDSEEVAEEVTSEDDGLTVEDQDADEEAEVEAPAAEEVAGDVSGNEEIGTQEQEEVASAEEATEEGVVVNNDAVEEPVAEEAEANEIETEADEEAELPVAPAVAAVAPAAEEVVEEADDEDVIDVLGNVAAAPVEETEDAMHFEMRGTAGSPYFEGVEEAVVAFCQIPERQSPNSSVNYTEDEETVVLGSFDGIIVGAKQAADEGVDTDLVNHIEQLAIWQTVDNTTDYAKTAKALYGDDGVSLFDRFLTASAEGYTITYRSFSSVDRTRRGGLYQNLISGVANKNRGEENIIPEPEPETPEEPEEPITPDEPEEPSEPVTPVTPEEPTPDEPVVPATPDEEVDVLGRIAPQTGDLSFLFLGVVILSLVGLAVTSKRK